MENNISDDNINDIFERKIEIGSVIQFNLLQRLIEEFIKRQQSLNDKFNNLEKKYNILAINSKITADKNNKILKLIIF